MEIQGWQLRVSILSHSHSSMPYSHFISSTPTLKFLSSESLSFLVETSLPKSPIPVSLSPHQPETRAKFQEIYLALSFRLVVMRCWVPPLTKPWWNPLPWLELAGRQVYQVLYPPLRRNANTWFQALFQAYLNSYILFKDPIQMSPNFKMSFGKPTMRFSYKFATA